MISSLPLFLALVEYPHAVLARAPRDIERLVGIDDRLERARDMVWEVRDSGAHRHVHLTSSRDGRPSNGLQDADRQFLAPSFEPVAVRLGELRIVHALLDDPAILDDWAQTLPAMHLEDLAHSSAIPGLRSTHRKAAAITWRCTASYS